jgi:fructokinase
VGKIRLGIDLGGTKTEIAALDDAGGFLLRRRVATPSTYEAILAVLAELLGAAERELGARGTLGIGIPGAISPASGRVKNASLLALNGHPLAVELAERLGRAVRVENDANCFALSEARDGAAAGAESAFGVIIGTGCGGGIVVRGRILSGRHRIAGEWGHTPLPWMTAAEYPGPPCWCGRRGCLETYLSGPALARDFFGRDARDAASVVARAASGDEAAVAALTRHASRLARGLAVVVDLLDP